MTIQELYANIGGDYDQAIKVLRMDKLVDKHIRRLTANGVVERLIAAGDTMDATELFESSHAVKGVCANLGLTGLSGAASEISEEFRPGNPRTLSDEEVKERLGKISDMYARTAEGIRQYEES
jgi:HPt (histidine-containing phosphotransfer) domain-containing protein